MIRIEFSLTGRGPVSSWKVEESIRDGNAQLCLLCNSLAVPVDPLAQGALF